MRFPLVLLATLLLFSTTLATVLQLPRYNVNDEEVGVAEVDAAWLVGVASLPPHEDPSNTPKRVQTAAREQFASLPSFAKKEREWVQDSIPCSDGDEERTAEIIRSVPDAKVLPVQDVCKLEKGNYYTWGITNDWQMAFGHAINTVEWGVKHANLANGRVVHVGGELYVTNDKEKIRWNCNSGTFSKPIAELIAKERGITPAEALKLMEVRMRKVWDVTDCPERIDPEASELFDLYLPKPNHRYIDSDLCPLLHYTNSWHRYYWPDVEGPICDHKVEECFD